jgi:hypothetical protein
MKGFLYSLFILLYANQTSARLDKREALLPICEAFNEDGNPQGAKIQSRTMLLLGFLSFLQLLLLPFPMGLGSRNYPRC